MKNLSYFIFCIALLPFAASCINMDIPPKNIITDDQVFNNEAGVEAYLAEMYSSMPMMDRCFSILRGYNDEYVTENISTLTGEALGRDQKSTVINGWWSYNEIRTVNMFIETLPEYAGYHTPENIRQWLGEAHFIRAFLYQVMAQRYGGVPLVTKVLNYPEEDIESFKIPRSSEEDTWKQIESDYQYAIDNCNGNYIKDRANKYTAAAYKSSAMLFAASIANFNDVSWHDTERNIRLCGIPKESAAYFYKSAWNAARLLEGQYSLYRGDWQAGNKEAQYLNFQNILQKPDNCESIFIKEFRYPDKIHSWDALYGPPQLKVDGLSGGVQPTVEFVELFEGVPKGSDGKLCFTDDNGKYIMYDDIMDPYRNAEPRLRATVIFPCDEFKGETIEIWRGVYTGTIPADGLAKLTKRDETKKYQALNLSDVLMSNKPETQTTYTKKDGTVMNCAGASGAYNNFAQGSLTGFLLRKNLDTSLPAEYVVQRRSESDWVDMRYAEVLLNRAEAAFELEQLGEPPAGTNWLEDAVTCINDIRDRAGCETLFTTATLTRDEVRNEFIRELAFENKAYWNYIRWRNLHLKHLSKVRYHSAMPFYAGEIDKWFYDIKYSDSAKQLTFNALNYYLSIPAAEISSNPNLVQNPK